MAYIVRKHSSTSNILRAILRNSSTGAGLTGLTSASSGLIISTICDLEATATTYTVAAGNVETITTLGTFAAPTSGKCRFKEVDATNHPGLYELQFADARFAVSNAKILRIGLTGAASLLTRDITVQLSQVNLDDAVRGGMTALPNANAEASGGLYTRGTGAGQINQDANGRIDANVTAFGGSAGTFASGRPEVNTSHVSGSAVSTSSAQIGVNVVNAAGTAWNSGAIGAATLASDTITAAKIAADAIGASELAADAASEIGSAVRTELTTELGRIDATVSSRLAPTVSGRTLDVTTTGEAGIDWANIGSPTTVVGLSGTTIKTATDVETDTADIQTRLPAALVSGRIDASVGAMAADTVTAAAIAADAIGSSELATSAVSEIVSAMWTTALTESYSADGVAPTPAQALFLILQRLTEFSIAGTSITVKKLDGSTTAFVLTLDDATSPTSSTRSS